MISPTDMLAYLRDNTAAGDGGCRVWRGQTHSGRPVARWPGERNARRLLVELSRPGRLLAPHELVVADCNERLCMNLRHLRVTTRSELPREMALAGRFPRGQRRSILSALGRAPRARLGIHRRGVVLEMIAAGATYAQIGERFGVSAGAVGDALQAWRRALGGQLR